VFAHGLFHFVLFSLVNFNIYDRRSNNHLRNALRNVWQLSSLLPLPPTPMTPIKAQVPRFTLYSLLTGDIPTPLSTCFVYSDA